MRPIKKYIPKRFRHFLLGWMARAGFFVGQALPRSFGLVLFSFLGRMFYYLLPQDRKRTINHLKFIFGNDWHDKQIRITAKRVFESIGKNLFDAIKLNTYGPEKFNKIVSHDPLDSWEIAKANGKGAIHVTAHLGCFEMLLHFFARKNFGRVIVVGRPFQNPAVDGVVRKMRSGPGIVYVDRSESPRNIVRMLRDGGMMGVLVDQDTSVEGIFADFLGHPAFTPSSAVRFAMKFDVPVIVSVTARLKGNKHHVFVSPIIERADTGDFEADLLSTMQRINGIISDYIRKFPEQWVWMHERWKTKVQPVEL